MPTPAISVEKLRRASALAFLAFLAPCVVEGAVSFFGGADAAAGRAENPALVDPNAPASERRGRVEGTLRLRAGLRAGWDRTDFEISYAPYLEYREDDPANRTVHFLESSWTHDYTSRLSLRLTDAFTHVPEMGLDPGSVRPGGSVAGDTTTTSNDFAGLLAYEAGPRTTLGFTYADARRIYSADTFVDSTHQAAGVDVKRRFGRHHSLLAGYEHALQAFADGLAPPVMGDPGDPNNGDPNGSDPNNEDPNGGDPNNSDPNCILFPWLCLPSPPGDPGDPAPTSAHFPAAGAAAPSAAMSADFRSVRRRARAGYAYDQESGFHFDLEGGQDHLTSDEVAAEPATTPYLRSSVGWNGAKLWARFGHVQGFHEGGGLFRNARARTSFADARIRFGDRVTLDLLAIEEVQQGLDEGGSLASPGRLDVFRGTGTLGYRLVHGLSLLLAFSHYRQSSEDLGEPIPDLRTNRHSLGVSWRFGPVTRPPPEARSAPP